jgi:hypothetical protein
MSLTVSFQKMDPWLGAVIIGAELLCAGANSIVAGQSDLAADVSGVGAIDFVADLLASAPPPPASAKFVPRGRRQDLYSEPPEFQPKFSNRTAVRLSLCPSRPPEPARRPCSTAAAPTGARPHRPCSTAAAPTGGRPRRPLLDGGRAVPRPPPPGSAPPPPSSGRAPSPPAHPAKAAAPPSSPGRAPSPPAHQAPPLPAHQAPTPAGDTPPRPGARSPPASSSSNPDPVR